MGLVTEILPCFRSASSSPTIRYLAWSPESVASRCTVAPKTTLSPACLVTSMTSALAIQCSTCAMRPST